MSDPGDESVLSGAIRRRIAEAMRRVSPVRLADYRLPTVLRHLDRRRRELGLADLAAYADRLDADAQEGLELAHDLLESTTVFFRDPEAYASLVQTLPHLLADAPAPRIWVPACAAGEDVYSIAMLVAQAQRAGEAPEDFLVLGSDVDLDLLREARRAVLSPLTTALVPAPLREAWLDIDQEGDGLLHPSIAALCAFVLHDVLTPPPLRDVDLVDCRNLLGSLNLPAQRRAVEQFASVLRPGGLLIVGRNDVMAAHNDLFERSPIAPGTYRRLAITPSVSQADTLPYARYRAALDRVDTPAAVLDARGVLLDANPVLFALLQQDRAWIGQPLQSLLDEGEWSRLSRSLDQSARVEADVHLHPPAAPARPARLSLSRWQAPEGERLIAEWRFAPAPGEPPVGGTGAHRLLQVGLEQMSESCIVTDALGSIVEFNPAAERLTGFSREQALATHHENVLRFIGDGAAASASPIWRCLRDDATPAIAEERQLLGRDGRRRRVKLSCVRLVDDPGGTGAGAMLLLHDVTEHALLLEELAYRGAHDALTGLFNRAEFQRRLDAALADARAEASCYWLGCIDIDQFKVINDTLGHFAGDELMRRLSALLRTQLRSQDVFARLGGDEFGVLIAQAEEGDARQVIERLQDAARGFRFYWDGSGYGITVSVGVAELNARSESVARVFADADAACFAAKDAGRDRSRWAIQGDADIRDRHEAMTMVGRIGQALDEQRFLLYYEDVAPAVSPGKVCYRELLVRMLDDEGKLVQPAMFIAAAERYSMMAALDRWVVDHAFRGIARLPADGIIYAINISGMSLSDEAFLAFVIGGLERHRVAPERICFEITETAAITHLPQAVRFVGQLVELGCRFALDDFGAGMASFSYLKSLRAQFVKIDGSFVRGMQSSAFDRSLVEAINRLGHDMGLRTIAEHVEDEATLRALAELGVDWVQGLVIAPGRPFSELCG